MPPELFGRYVFGDYCTGQIWAMDPVGAGWQSTLIVDEGFGLTSFGEDVDGELYVTLGDEVYRLVPIPAPVPTLGVVALALLALALVGSFALWSRRAPE